MVALLTLDIETMGLMHQNPLPPMTCVCLYDGTRKYEFPFICITEAEHNANAEALLHLLDTTAHLAGFNAVLFDLPYIGRALDVPEEHVAAWQAKCIDPYMGMRSTLHQTCKLQALLDANGLESKTGSGLEAIRLAREGRVRELLDYCMMDVLLTHELCMLPEIRVTQTLGITLGDDLRWSACHYERPQAPTLIQALALTHPLPTVDRLLQDGFVTLP